MFSSPTYTDLRLDLTGRAHLFAGIGGGRLALDRIISEATDAAAPFSVIYDVDPGVDVSGPLLTFLSQAHMGLRVYFAGPESFLWAAMRTAAPFGFGRNEIQLHLSEQSGRDVFCVHCKHINRQVKSAQHSCTGCGIFLGVRNHFSRRLGCYLGVCA